ncbi:hypothetical protein swp_3918 [Shewanella piezotolerans WP3]|uniref:Uncharacterized protein n=1 Tax=Shewanella piezotolerans (strain WP3 / JCM 13877) TaxID=225849 RepID=B8CSG7_SHEPW|nr:hypothetical protein swp_3918 [Shewanella piezotolerans WP3]
MSEQHAWDALLTYLSLGAGKQQGGTAQINLATDTSSVAPKTNPFPLENKIHVEDTVA